MTVKFDNLLPPEKMNKMDDYELRKRRQIGLMKSLLDYGIGIMIIIAGLVWTVSVCTFVSRCMSGLMRCSHPMSWTWGSADSVCCMVHGACTWVTRESILNEIRFEAYCFYRHPHQHSHRSFP